MVVSSIHATSRALLEVATVLPVATLGEEEGDDHDHHEATSLSEDEGDQSGDAASTQMNSEAASRWQYFTSGESMFSGGAGVSSQPICLSYCLECTDCEDCQGCYAATHAESLDSSAPDATTPPNASAWESLVTEASWAITGPQTGDETASWDACRYYDVGDVREGILEAALHPSSGAGKGLVRGRRDAHTTRACPS